MEYFHQFSEHEVSRPHRLHTILLSKRKRDVIDQWLVITWLVVCAACDALIAAGIAYSLRLSRTGIRA